MGWEHFPTGMGLPAVTIKNPGPSKIPLFGGGPGFEFTPEGCLHRPSLFGYATRFVYRPSARPGATVYGYVKVFKTYDCFAFHHYILMYQVWARVALYFDDTRLTNPDTSGATAIPLLAGLKNILKN